MAKLQLQLKLVAWLAFGLLIAAPNAQAQCIFAPEYLAVLAGLSADAASRTVVAGPDEPGQRLVVTGRVVDGTTPIAGAAIYVFHADAKGLYAPGNSDATVAELRPRLHGEMRTDAEGRYRFETIRPRSYEGLAAHIHYVVAAAGYKTRLFDLQFQDDPLLVALRAAGAPEIPQSIRNSPCFKSQPDLIAIRPVRRDDTGIPLVVADIDVFRE